MASMILAGAAGLAVYSRKPILAAVGFTRREAYLEDRAQDYEAAQAILHVPTLNGDPSTSFEADPERLKTPEQWKEFLKVKGIAYVVRAPDYPVVVAAPLEELERRGDLVHFGQREVGNRKGLRIDQARITVPVIILKSNF
jgi:hypothetical protein